VSIHLRTKQKILDAAERLFAKHGFEATSLRAIISIAGVNLAAIHYHFRTKENLVRAVIERRFAPLNDERLALLNRFEQEAAGQSLPVERIVEAFLSPTLRVGLADSKQGQLLMQLGGHILLQTGEMLERAIGQEFQRVAVRFLGAFQRALPGVGKQELAWRMNLTIGAAAKAMFGGVPLRVLSNAAKENLQPRDVKRVTERLIVYTSAGMRTPPADPKGCGERMDGGNRES